MKSIAKDYGIHVKVGIETDFAAGRGLSLRLGAGKVRHVDTQWLWIQVAFHGKETTFNDIADLTNEADLMTEFLDGPRINEVMTRMGVIYASGRSNLAFRAAL